MARTVLCITKAFEKPKALTDLVIFSDERPMLPSGDLASYLRYCSNYAREYQVYLVPHRFVINNQLTLCLFDPQGEIVGYQAALHRHMPSQNRLEQGDDINIMQTPIGNLFLCVDCDIYHPEILRLAKLKGADLIISSQYIAPNDLKPRRITSGIWNAAQQQGVYVVGCSNVFCAVAAPWEICPDGSGFLIQPEASSQLFCKLYFNKLERCTMGGNLASKLNEKLCQRYASLLGQP